MRRRRRRHRLDVLHAVSAARSNGDVVARDRSACSSSGFSSILTGLNFIATIHKLRAPGMTWFRLPLFVWAIYATASSRSSRRRCSASRCCCSPSSGVRHRHLRPGARRRSGAVPALLLVLLAPRRLHHDPARHGRRQRDHRRASRAGRSSATGSSRARCVAIALVGFLVWGHHMFVSGQSAFASMVFCALTFLVAIPSAIKVFNWVATLYKGSITLSRRRCSTRSASSGCSRSAASRACSSGRSRSTCTCTTRTSSSRTSTTSWWAARSSPSSAACTTGGRR